jgi:hypothetical protein
LRGGDRPAVTGVLLEFGLFENAGGRYSDGVPNLDVYLKSHPGDDLRVDRVSRSPLHVRKPALTLGLVVQPDVIWDLARKPGFRGSGLSRPFRLRGALSKLEHEVRASAAHVDANRERLVVARNERGDGFDERFE